MGSNGNGEFHIGDRVVYPNHGVGIVEQIGTRTLGQAVERYYLLNIKSSNLKVTIPFHSVGIVGLRRVVKNGDIQKILDYLEDGNGDSAADWKDKSPVGRVRIVTRDGRSFDRRGDKVPGSPESPMTWDELTAKFRGCALAAAAPLPADRIETAAALAREFDSLADVRQFVRVLAP